MSGLLKIILVQLCILSVGKAAWIYSWGDDFDGEAGSPPDSSKWTYDIGDEEDYGELEYFTSSTSNSALDGNGNLMITVRTDDADQYQCWYGTCQYTSASLNTYGLFNQTYGRYEARLQYPTGKGLWPAFWLLGTDIDTSSWPDCGEIVISEERGSDPTTVLGAVFGPGYEDGDGISASYQDPDGGLFSDSFHVFAIEWFPGSITWLVDDVNILTLTPDDLNGNQWVFDHPFYVILDVAVGGSFDGDPDGSVNFPQSLVLDYVHVYFEG